jgi:hypothetical protein
MKTKFKVREREYEVDVERRLKGESDKLEPFTATVSGQPGGPVKGTMQFTPEAVEAAEKKAASDGTSFEELCARASARSLAAEVLIRKLKPDFSFVVDHRWIK